MMALKFRGMTPVVFTFAVFLTLAIVFFSSCSKTPPNPPPSEAEDEQTLTVFTSKPVIQDVTLTCRVVGNAVPWKTVRVSSETGGVVESLHFEKGDRKQKGNLLAVIDPVRAQAHYDRATAQYNIALANHGKMKALTRPQELDIAKSRLQPAIVQHEEAEKTYNRLKALLKSGDIRQSQFDTAETAFNVTAREVSAATKQLELAQIGARKEDLTGSAAQLAQADASLRLAKEQLDDSRITAPLDGTIVEKNIEEGEITQPGSPIATLVDITRIKIKTRIPEMEAARIQPDLPVHVTIDALPEQSFTGRLAFLSVAADRLTHSFPAEVVVDNPDGRIRSGMICRLQFVREIRPDALLIDGDALWVRENGTGVFVIRDGKAFFKPVRTGASVGDRLVVESGVERDDVLITTAPSGLVSGQEVIVGETVKRP